MTDYELGEKRVDWCSRTCPGCSASGPTSPVSNRSSGSPSPSASPLDPKTANLGLTIKAGGAVSIIRAIQRKEGLRFPCIGVNTGLMKHLFDNRCGTGQSTVEGLLAATNLTVCGKVVTVAGYG